MRRGTPPDIVLYVFDSLRRDRLSCYGRPGGSSPNLDALARDGVLFLDAYATATWTRPSAGSIVTGAYPPVHGADGMESGLRPGIATLAERLSARGYRSLGFSTNAQVSAATGFARGFAEFVEIEFGTRGVQEVTASSDRMNRLAIRRIEEASDAPLFLMLWSTDTHVPYDHPGAGAEAGARIGRAVDLADVFSIGRAQGEEERAAIEAAYDSAVRFNDRTFGELMAALRAAGRYDDALILVASDHGELFGRSRGEFWKMRGLLSAWPMAKLFRAAGIASGRCWIGHHCVIPYEELIRIPWIAKLPRGRGAGARIRERVCLVDAMPTILDLIGEPWDRPSIQGLSLLPAIERGEDRTLRDRIIFSHSRLYRFCSAYVSAIGPEGKYVRVRHPALAPADLRTRPRYIVFTALERLLGEREILFRIGEDGAERRARPAAGELALWRGRLAAWDAANASALASVGGGEGPRVDLIERLRALGYV